MSTRAQIKVLVVDDSLIITERMAAIAGEAHCVSEVFISTDYTGALAIIEAKNPDVILLDIHLPGKSGMELLSYLRKNRPFVKVIMVTNKASDYYRALCRKAGADHFIDKSKEFETITGIIESYC